MDAPLPPEWTQQVSSRTGLTYWFNSRSGESTYTRPTEFGPPHPAAAPTDAVAPPLAKRARVDAPPQGVQPERGAVDAGGAAAAAAVAGAYDHLVDAGVEGRRGSALLHLKNFNNWVKAVLIAEYAPRPCARVLDLACGKLGDLAKWRLAGVREYCGVDISRTAVDDARSRFNDGNRGGALAARLARADLGVVDLGAAGVFAAGETFDAVSIQFALHYLFRSEARALAFFINVAGRLRPGGVLLGTIPDAALLVRRLRAARGPAGDGAPAFGNALFSVRFPPDAAAAAAAGLGAQPYGCRYTFWLSEAVDHVDEYLVPWPLLERLAAAAGLVPLARDNFHDFYARMAAVPRHAETARTMRVFNCEGSLSPDEWEAAGVYRVFAFRRPAAGEPPAVAPPGVALPPWAALGLPPTAAARAPPPYAAFVRPEDIVDTLGGSQ